MGSRKANRVARSIRADSIEMRKHCFDGKAGRTYKNMSYNPSPIGEPWTTKEQAESERIMRIIAPVPFVTDWVEYRGEIVFAEVNTEKSGRCGRPIIEIGYCATRVLVNHIIDSSHNYSPETFKWCRLSSESWKPSNP